MQFNGMLHFLLLYMHNGEYDCYDDDNANKNEHDDNDADIVTIMISICITVYYIRYYIMQIFCNVQQSHTHVVMRYKHVLTC